MGGCYVCGGQSWRAFQDEICHWAWEFLTSKLHIPPDQLYVTYFGGDADSGLSSDEECKRIWHEIG